MHSFLLTIAYDGTRYAGWQIQAGQDTVQERMENAVRTIFGERVTVHGAGRTDAGVHALRQCAHFRTGKRFEPVQLLRALNGNLPADIAVRAVRPVPPGFHARFSARGKRYVYRCRVDPVRPVHAVGFYHWVKRPVDVSRMCVAAAHLVGEHDFAGFAANPGYPRRRGTVRRLDHVRIVPRSHGFDVFAQGNGFLYKMVRAVAGTLLQVGQGMRQPHQMLEILSSRDRRSAGPNAPAHGLYLQRVLYTPDSLSIASDPELHGFRGDSE